MTLGRGEVPDADASGQRGESPRLQADFDAAAAKCSLLSRDQAQHFVEHGHVVVRQAFSKEFAKAVVRQAWADLGDKHGIDPRDRRTWGRSFGAGGHIPGYFRTAGSHRRFVLQAEAPKAFQAIADVLGGAERLPADGAGLAWGDGAVANLGAAGEDSKWRPPSVRQRTWHKDGWHFRHFLDSPEQGLLAVPIYSDILPRSGGTFIASDSIAPVARLLAAHPEGLHADSVQGAGYLIPGLVEQCSAFDELTGEAGDMVLVHPYMLHRPCLNPSPRPRFIANAAVVLAQPMRFDRTPPDAHSLVELAVLRGLGRRRLQYEIAQPREAVKPAPFRDDEQRAAQSARLQQEMQAMAERGVLTPGWAAEFGYQSNAAEVPPRSV